MICVRTVGVVSHAALISLDKLVVSSGVLSACKWIAADIIWVLASLPVKIKVCGPAGSVKLREGLVAPVKSVPNDTVLSSNPLVTGMCQTFDSSDAVSSSIVTNSELDVPLGALNCLYHDSYCLFEWKRKAKSSSLGSYSFCWLWDKTLLG